MSIMNGTLNPLAPAGTKSNYSDACTHKLTFEKRFDGTQAPRAPRKMLDSYNAIGKPDDFYDDGVPKLDNKDVSKFNSAYANVQPAMGNTMEVTNVKKKSRFSSDEADTDYQSLILKDNINPAVLKNHKQFVAERQKYAKQPAMPDDNIETNYINFTGFANVSRVYVSDTARQTNGLEYSQYNYPMNFSIG